MDKCYINDKMIEQYLFGRLEDDEETAFQQHLFNCAICSAKIQRLRSLAESFRPETIAQEEKEIEMTGEIGETARVVPFVRKMRPWFVAASIALVFAAGWMAGRYKMQHDMKYADNIMQTQTERLPEYATGESITEKSKKEFTFISPGEGKYLFNINEKNDDENEMIFKWSPTASHALLIIKTNDGLWDEIKTKDTDHIRVNLTKYSSHKSLTWFLIVSESEDVMKGTIDLR